MHGRREVAGKGLIPYRGLGSGIKRALKKWPNIDFIEDREGCVFTVKIYQKSSPEIAKRYQKILELMLNNPEITIEEISEQIGWN